MTEKERKKKRRKTLKKKCSEVSEVVYFYNFNLFSLQSPSRMDEDYTSRRGTKVKLLRKLAFIHTLPLPPSLLPLFAPKNPTKHNASPNHFRIIYPPGHEKSTTNLNSSPSTDFFHRLLDKKKNLLCPPPPPTSPPCFNSTLSDRSPPVIFSNSGPIKSVACVKRGLLSFIALN